MYICIYCVYMYIYWIYTHSILVHRKLSPYETFFNLLQYCMCVCIYVPSLSPFGSTPVTTWYRLNCEPPKFIYWSPNPLACAYIWILGFKEVVKLTWADTGVLVSWFLAEKRRWGQRQREVRVSPWGGGGRQPAPEGGPRGRQHLSRGFLGSRAVRKLT